MAKKKEYDQNSTISDHPFFTPSVYKTEDGVEYIFERSGYHMCTLKIGSHEAKFQCGSNNKAVCLRVEGLGWYYPMKMEIPEKLAGWFTSDFTPNTLMPVALDLIKEFREFKKEMEEVSEE